MPTSGRSSRRCWFIVPRGAGLGRSSTRCWTIVPRGAGLGAEFDTVLDYSSARCRPRRSSTRHWFIVPRGAGLGAKFDAVLDYSSARCRLGAKFDTVLDYSSARCQPRRSSTRHWIIVPRGAGLGAEFDAVLDYSSARCQPRRSSTRCWTIVPRGAGFQRPAPSRVLNAPVWVAALLRRPEFTATKSFVTTNSKNSHVGFSKGQGRRPSVSNSLRRSGRPPSLRPQNLS